MIDIEEQSLTIINYFESSEIVEERTYQHDRTTSSTDAIDSRQYYLLNVCDARSSRSFIFGD